MKVKEIFYFIDGTTVFIGEILNGPKVIKSCQVCVLLDEVHIADITLVGERSSGPNLLPNCRVVYTLDSITFDKSLNPERYTLVYSK